MNTTNRGSCVNCSRFSFDSGCGGYSEYTPGYEWSIECGKSHYSMAGTEVTREEYRLNLNRAIDCPDFEPYVDPTPSTQGAFVLTTVGMAKLVNGLALAHVVLMSSYEFDQDDAEVNADHFLVNPRPLNLTREDVDHTAKWYTDPVEWEGPVEPFDTILIYDPADLAVVAYQIASYTRQANKGDHIKMGWGDDGREFATIGPDL